MKSLMSVGAPSFDECHQCKQSGDSPNDQGSSSGDPECHQ